MNNDTKNINHYQKKFKVKSRSEISKIAFLMFIELIEDLAGTYQLSDEDLKSLKSLVYQYYIDKRSQYYLNDKLALLSDDVNILIESAFNNNLENTLFDNKNGRLLYNHNYSLVSNEYN